METSLDILDQNYEAVKASHGVVDTRYYIGEIKECTPEQFAQEANIVLDAYVNGKTQPLVFGDDQQ